MNLESSTTFREFQVRLCEHLGIADLSGNAPAPTGDPRELDMVKRVINEAVKELWSASDPRTGQTVRWSFATPLISLKLSADGNGPYNIAGDPYRYRLPRGVVSAPIGKVIWQDESGGGGYVRDTSIDMVLRKIASDPRSSGPPMYVAVWHDSTSEIQSGETVPLELRVYPRPHRSVTITARFRVEPVRMVNDGDRPMVPSIHDNTILDLAVERAVSTGGITSATDVAVARERSRKSLIASIDADYDMRPNSMGRPFGMPAWTAGQAFSTPGIVTTSGHVIMFS